jgi:hypothetical protein
VQECCHYVGADTPTVCSEELDDDLIHVYSVESMDTPIGIQLPRDPEGYGFGNRLHRTATVVPWTKEIRKPLHSSRFRVLE